MCDQVVMMVGGDDDDCNPCQTNHSTAHTYTYTAHHTTSHAQIREQLVPPEQKGPHQQLLLPNRLVPQPFRAEPPPLHAGGRGEEQDDLEERAGHEPVAGDADEGGEVGGEPQPEDELGEEEAELDEVLCVGGVGGFWVCCVDGWLVGGVVG